MRSLCYIFLLICLFACAKEARHNGNGIEIPTNELNVSISDIFTDFSIVSLETSERSFIGSISKIELYDGKFYLLDKSTTKQVHIFDTLGNYISNVGNIGRGNGEYLNIEDFTLTLQRSFTEYSCPVTSRIACFNTLSY